MAECSITCKVVPAGDGSFLMILVVDNVTSKEAHDIGNMLHDPAAKAVHAAINDRITPTTHFTSTRGRTQ